MVVAEFIAMQRYGYHRTLPTSFLEAAGGGVLVVPKHGISCNFSKQDSSLLRDC